MGTYYYGKRCGAKRFLVDTGITPYIASAILATAKTLGTHTHAIPGATVRTKCEAERFLTFYRRTYTVNVWRGR